MPMTNIHCVNVISPRRPGCRTHAVRLVLVQASNPAEAVAKVAASLSRWDNDCRVQYRNSFGEPGDEDILVWSHQTWTRADAEGCGQHVGSLRAAMAANPEALEA